jgi:FkbM family methyltransferase
MRQHIRALKSLLSETESVGGKWSLFWAVVVGELFRSHFRTHAKYVTVPFKPFTLRFQVAHGELTPYLELYHLVRSIAPPVEELRTWTIVDCGANVGMFSLFLRQARRLVAVEPNPKCVEKIRENFRINAVAGEVLPFAVTEVDGEVRMNFNQTASTLSHISQDGDSLVAGKSLPAIAEIAGLDEVDLLKLDLEGFELPALQGASRWLASGKVKRIFFEFYGDEQLAKLESLLLPHGFVRRAIFEFNALYVLDGII